MGRMVKGWTPEAVEGAPVAPHRYRWDLSVEELNAQEPDNVGYAAFVRAAPYKPGDVIWTVYGDGCVKARVVAVLANLPQWYSDYRHVYRVQKATKRGYWSRLWIETHPGLIQRGYGRAGLAPEMPETEWK